MLQGVRVGDVENDGRVGEIRYFSCPRGQGLFLPERFVRRSFVQRAPPPQPQHQQQPFTPPATSGIPRRRFYSTSGAPVPASLEYVDSLEALLGLPLGSLGPHMADARAGVIYELAPPPPHRHAGSTTAQQRSGAKAAAAAKLQLFQGMHATITGAGDVVKDDEPLGATGGSAGSFMTETGLAAEGEDRGAMTGSTISWGGGDARREPRVQEGETDEGAFLRTQAFARSGSLSVSASSSALSDDDRARLGEAVDLVQEALRMEADEGGAVQLTGQAFAATATMMTTTTAAATAAAGEGEWEEEEEEDTGAADGMDRAAMYFEVAARYLENLAAALAAQGAEHKTKAEEGTSRTCLAAAVVASSSRRRPPAFH